MDQKGLLTSLATFIVMGLLSLAALFTLLILDVRDGQESLNTLLTQHGTDLSPATSATDQTNRSEPLPAVIHTDPEVDQRLQDIETSIQQLTEQLSMRSTPQPPTTDLAPQLQQIQQQLQKIETSSSSAPTSLVPEQLTQDLGKLTVWSERQQQRQAKNATQIDQLLLQGEAQRHVIESILKQMEESTSSAPHTPPSDGAIRALTQKLDTLAQQQQQIEKALQALGKPSQQDQPYRYQAR